MKQTFTLLSLVVALLLSVQSNAQSYEIRDSLGTLVNDDTLWLPGDGTESTIKAVLRSTNVSMATLETKMVRTEVEVPANTENYFCWSLCYNAVDAGDNVVWEDQTPVWMVPDSIYTKLRVYHKPKGETGRATYRYKLFNRSMPSDSASFVVIFDVPLGLFGPVQERPAGEASVAPNPADGWVNFNYKGNADAQQRSLVVYDLLGNQVDVQPLPNQRGTITLNTDEFAPGIYVMSLRENGQPIATKKLVVDH